MSQDYSCAKCGGVFYDRTSCPTCFPTSAELADRERKRRADCFEQLVAALERCHTLAWATIDFIAENDLQEYLVTYDDSECDGVCLGQDWEVAALNAREALAKAKEGQG